MILKGLYDELEILSLTFRTLNSMKRRLKDLTAYKYRPSHVNFTLRLKYCFLHSTSTPLLSVRDYVLSLFKQE